MNGASHEQRLRAIFEFLYVEPVGLLHRYAVPQHMSNEVIIEEVNDLVAEINAAIPSGTTSSDLADLLGDLRAAVRRSYGARGWPPAKVFIEATEVAVAALRRRAAARVLSESGPWVQTETGKWVLDPYVVSARRMARREAVGEHMIFGRQAQTLLDRGLVDEATLALYRKGAAMARLEVYGPEDAGTPPG